MLHAGCQVEWPDGPAAHQPELLLQEGDVLRHEGRDRLLDHIQAKEEKCGWLIVSELAGKEPLRSLQRRTLLWFGRSFRIVS